MANVASSYFNQAILSGAISATSAAGILSTSKLNLFTNNFTPTGASVLADFTLASYTGYSQKSVSWGTVFDEGDGSWSVTSNAVHEFTGPTSGAGVTAYGYVVTDGATPQKVLWSELLAASKTLTTTTDAVNVVPGININNADIGGGTVID